MNKQLHYKLEKVSIKGFWGNHEFICKFNKDINFLIGQNGSGKTTAINIISAVTLGNYKSLLNLPFKSVEMVLKTINKNTKVKIIVEKNSNNEGMDYLKYSVKEGGKGGELRTLDLNERDAYYLKRRGILPPPRSSKGNPLDSLSFHEYLKSLLNPIWLSVSRNSEKIIDDYNENLNDIGIDSKLDILYSEISRKLTILDKRIEAQTEYFRKEVFLDLLKPAISFEDYSPLLKSFDLTIERQGLIEVFKDLNLLESEYKDNIHQLFKNLTEVKQAVAERKQWGLDIEKLYYLFIAPKLHDLVKRWENLQIERRKIHKTKNTFLEIINKLFSNKTFLFSDDNILYSETESGKILKLSELSSGEKQMLIVLGEMLLQGETHCLYIADEPELSLHIKWQSLLVNSIKQLNPNAQILFATHSPDIVASYSDYTINMEKTLV